MCFRLTLKNNQVIDLHLFIMVDIRFAERTLSSFHHLCSGNLSLVSKVGVMTVKVCFFIIRLHIKVLLYLFE